MPQNLVLDPTLRWTQRVTFGVAEDEQAAGREQAWEPLVIEQLLSE